MNQDLTTKRTKVTKEVTTLGWPPSFVAFAAFAAFVVMLPAVHGLPT